jgi:predicted  nucleic acid-binding Zn-ribbon protein
MRAELEQARAETKSAQDALAACKTQAETRLQAYEAAQRERDDLEPQVKAARAQMAELQASLKALREKEEGQAAGWKKQVADLQKEVARLKAGVPSAADMEQALNEQIESLTRQLRAVRDEASQRETRLQDVLKENESLKAGR